MIRIFSLAVLSLGLVGCAHSNQSHSQYRNVRSVGQGQYAISPHSPRGWTRTSYDNALYRGEQFCKEKGLIFQLNGMQVSPYKTVRYTNYYYGSAEKLTYQPSHGVRREMIFTCNVIPRWDYALEPHTRYEDDYLYPSYYYDYEDPTYYYDRDWEADRRHYSSYYYY